MDSSELAVKNLVISQGDANSPNVRSLFNKIRHKCSFVQQPHFASGSPQSNCGKSMTTKTSHVQWNVSNRFICSIACNASPGGHRSMYTRREKLRGERRDLRLRKKERLPLSYLDFDKIVSYWPNRRTRVSGGNAEDVPDYLMANFSAQYTTKVHWRHSDAQNMTRHSVDHDPLSSQKTFLERE